MSAAASISGSADPLGSSGHPQYTLTSDIAQFCFPSASRDSNRKYAYACSIYIAFLLIGLIGVAKAPVLVVKELPPAQEYMPVEIPPAEVPPPVTVMNPVDEATPPDPTETAPPVPVLVAPANAPVPFAVPTEGYVAVTKLVTRASAPPAVAPRPPPAAAPKPNPAMFRRGGGSRPNGTFPEPAFPSGMLRSGQTVELVLRVELADDGTPATVEAETSSGLLELDRKVTQHVKSRWRWDPGQSKLWLIPFAFQCR